MKQIVLAERKARAQNRIAAAATELATRIDVPDDLRESSLQAIKSPPVKARNPDIARMFQLEGIADFLELLVDPAAAIERSLRDELDSDSNRLEQESGESDDSGREGLNGSDDPIRSEIVLLTSLADEQKKAMIEDDIATFADFNFLTEDELSAFYGIDAESALSIRNEIARLLAEPTMPVTQADFGRFDLPDSVRESLQDAYPDFEAVASASDDDLMAIEGIGAARVKVIRDTLSELGVSRADQG